MDPFHLAYIIVLVWIALGAPKPAEAAEIDRSSISVQHGSDFKLGDKSRDIITFETLHKRDNYLLYVTLDNQSFSEPTSYVTSRVVAHGGKDFHVALQLANQKSQSATGIGLGYSQFTTRGFYGVDVYKRSDNILGEGVHYFGYWNYKLPYGFVTDGFVDYVNTDGIKNPTILAQPALMYGLIKSFSAGIEYQLYWNKFDKGVDESVPQAKIKYTW